MEHVVRTEVGQGVEASAAVPDQASPQGAPAPPLGRSNALATVVAACLAPLAYLLFLNHYAVNSPLVDDWFNVPLVHSALHGHLALTGLWAQYNNSRILIGRLFFVLFGLVDHLNLRAVIFFSAVVFIASYAILLVVFRRYVGRRLTPVPVLVIGATWFSVADVGNSLWAFQLSWYLVPFFLVVMLYALLMPRTRSTFWFSVAILAAVGGSLSTVQGFVLWPAGVICVAWGADWVRKTFLHIAVWVAASIITVVVYIRGFNFATSNCTNPARGPRICLTNNAFHNPLGTLHFVLVLMGSVVPGGTTAQTLARAVVIGAVLMVVALAIVVQSWRQRATSERLPLALLLIVFSLLFDVMIGVGRASLGLNQALATRYLMPNVILLVGMAVYALGHIPPLRRSRVEADGVSSPRRFLFIRTALAAGAIVLVLQVVDSTNFGFTQGRASHQLVTAQARIVVHLDRMPARDRPCELRMALEGLYSTSDAERIMTPILKEATEDRLSLFQPGQVRADGLEGPAFVSATCRMPDSIG